MSLPATAGQDRWLSATEPGLQAWSHKKDFIQGAAWLIGRAASFIIEQRQRKRREGSRGPWPLAGS